MLGANEIDGEQEKATCRSEVELEVRQEQLMWSAQIKQVQRTNKNWPD